MLFSKAKTLKDTASTAKRTATALRHLSGSSEFELADRGLLLKAAETLTVFSTKKSREAKTAKAAEDAHEKALAKATQEASALLAEWKVTTTLDKVAMAAGLFDGNCRLRNELDHLASGRIIRNTPQWGLNYLLDEALRDIPRSAAYDAVTKKTTVAFAMAAARARYETARADAGLAWMAEQFDHFFQRAERAAA